MSSTTDDVARRLDPGAPAHEYFEVVWRTSSDGAFKRASLLAWEIIGIAVGLHSADEVQPIGIDIRVHQGRRSRDSPTATTANWRAGTPRWWNAGSGTARWASSWPSSGRRPPHRQPEPSEPPEPPSQQSHPHDPYHLNQSRRRPPMVDNSLSGNRRPVRRATVLAVVGAALALALAAPVPATDVN